MSDKLESYIVAVQLNHKIVDIQIMTGIINLLHADLQVTSLPSVLFHSNGGLHTVVEGSVIQLYCSVESTTASFSWTKDGNRVVIDVPHLQERTANDDTTTTSVLTVDNFQSSDTGTYQCSARDGMRTGNGASVTLNSSFQLLN